VSTVRRARTRFVVTLVSLAVAGVTTVGCGSGTSTQADQPAGSDGALIGGDFTTLPKPDGAVPIADPTVEGRTTAQSFKVIASGVEEIAGFYELQLPEAGWQARSTPTAFRDTDWRGAWVRTDQTLEVSVSPYNGDGQDSSQLDLVLTG
jgi:hypothetical protein